MPDLAARRGPDLAAQQQDLHLPVPYFLVTFTLPPAPRNLARRRQRQIYAMLFRASAAALQQLAPINPLAILFRAKLRAAVRQTDLSGQVPTATWRRTSSSAPARAIGSWRRTGIGAISALEHGSGLVVVHGWAPAEGQSRRTSHADPLLSPERERVAAPATFNEDYVAATRHMNPSFVRRRLLQVGFNLVQLITR